MQEAVTIFIRYVLIAIASYFGSMYSIDKEILDALVSAGTASVAIVWLIKVRFMKKDDE